MTEEAQMHPILISHKATYPEIWCKARMMKEPCTSLMMLLSVHLHATTLTKTHGDCNKIVLGMTRNDLCAHSRQCLGKDLICHIGVHQ